jgi:leucyl-tRNA synthetase
MMIFVNEMNKKELRPRAVMDPFVLLLSPFAPHLAEELWQLLGHNTSLAYEPWPEYDAALTADDEIELVLQVNGKVRDKILVPTGLDKQALEAVARESEIIRRHAEGKTIVKIIAVPDKLVNVVVR